MNKAEFIKGLNMTIEGLTAIRDAVESDGDVSGAKTSVATKSAVGGAKKTPATKTAPKTESASEKGGQTYTTAELTAMKYNEFKKLASSLGVDCKGTRDEIMARVVALGVVTDAEDTPATPAKDDKKSVAKGGKSNKPASGGKLGAKKAESNDKDEYDEQAEEIAKSTDVSDIIEALKDVGVKATKLNYKTQLAKALRDGLIEVDGEDEAEDEESGGDEEVSADSYFAEYDIHEVNDPDSMSDERASACNEKQAEILEAVTNEELDADTIVDYLQNNATQEELDLLGDEYSDDDLVKLYIEVYKHFIDEDGEEHEPGEAYMIGEDAYCCGQPLAYDKKTKKFLCAHCASEYEAE